MLTHLPLAPRTSLAFRLAWLEAVARDPTLDQRREWAMLEGEARQVALGIESAPNPMKLDAALRNGGTALAGSRPMDRRIAKLSSSIVASTPECRQCADRVSASACDGRNANEDDRVALQGDCLNTLRQLLEEVAASVHGLYERALGRSLAMPGLCLETGELSSDPIGLGVAGEYRRDCVRLLFSEKFRREGSVVGYRSLPYVVTHEVLSHAYWGRGGRAQINASNDGTEPTDAFAEGWMDMVAQNYLSRVAFSLALKSRIGGMLARCVEDCARYAEVRCIRPEWPGTRPNEGSLACYRQYGREAAGNLLRAIKVRCPDQTAHELWTNMSCAWNAAGIKVVSRSVPTSTESMISALRSAIPHRDALPLVAQVDDVVEKLILQGKYLNALEELTYIGEKWFGQSI